MKYTVQHRFNQRVFYVFNNRQDAENAILNLEDMYGVDYRDLVITESEV